MTISTTPSLLVYSSSAGSGKTYTLALEFLKIILGNEDPLTYKKILAVTFTNDAAAEMSHRILENLKILAFEDLQDAKSLNTRADLLSKLIPYVKENGFDITDSFIYARAKDIYLNILNDYGSFGVSTIDSFVQRIIGAFAIQLGYNYGSELVLDANIVFEPMIENLFTQVAEDESGLMTKVIIEYAQDLIDQGKSWSNIPKTMSQFAQKTLSEEAIEPIKRLEAIETEDLFEIKKQVVKALKKIEEDLHAAINDVIIYCENIGLEIADFSGKSQGGFLASFISWGKKDIIEIFNKDFSATFLKNIETEKLEHNKTNKQAIFDIHKPRLIELYHNFENLRTASASKYKVLLNVSKNIGNISLLKYFAQELHKIKEVDNKVHISDFPKAIFEVVSNEPVPYIYERIGVKYQYIMIDEFQDTSPIQFYNFLPLLSNILAQDLGKILLVGDPKQSIYSFRGGDMKLIVAMYNQTLGDIVQDEKPESFVNEHLLEIKNAIKPKNLNTNYRSKSNIIEFNNHLFDFLRKQPQLQANLNIIEKVFDDTFFQELSPFTKTGGHVQFDIWATEKSAKNKGNDDKDNDDDGEIIDDIESQKILDIVKHAIERGYQMKDIAILCRSNETASKYAVLLKNEQYSVQSSESLLLKNSKSIQLILAILKLIQKDDKSLRKQFILKFFEYYSIKNFGEINYDLLQWSELPLLNNFFEQFKNYQLEIDLEKCKTLGVFEIIEHLYQQLNLLQNQSEQDYLLAFIDVLLKFKLNKSNQITAFFEYWELEGQKISLNVAAQNAITVLTIHKAKGLQYEIVILPTINWQLKPKPLVEHWADLSVFNYDELQLNEKSVKLEDSIYYLSERNKIAELEPAANFYTEKSVVETINIFYVACTRAISELFILGNYTPPDKENKDENHIPKLGYFLNKYALANATKVKETICVIKENITNRIENYVVDNQLNTITLNTNEPLASKMNIKVSIEVDNLNQKLALEKGAAFGTKLHNILAEITYKNEVETVLESYFKRNLLNQQELEKIKEKVFEIINDPILSSYFEKPAQVLLEAEFLQPNGKTFRADRIITLNNKTVVLDYKTGTPAESHILQIKNYQKILLEMGYNNVSAILVYTAPFYIQQIH